MERAPQFALRVFERHSRNATDHGKYRRFGLFVEKARLRGRHHCGGWFAPGDAHDPKHGNLRERRARHKNTVARGIQVGRHNLQAVIEQRQKIIGDDPFEDFPIIESQLDPKTIELGAAQEGLALRLELIGKLANEIDGADFGDGELDMLPFRGKHIDGIELAESGGIQIAAQRFPVGQHKHDFLVGRGWGFGFQARQIPGWEVTNLPIGRMYVMLIALFLSTYCF